jgi:ligand-binding SRPBCC domain-containing protein
MNADTRGSPPNSVVSGSIQIELEMLINAPIERCFDLARSIDLHVRSAGATREKAVAGVTTGLISEGQEVGWRARHFGLWLKMRVRITGYKPPYYFQDSMITGPFRTFCHNHYFEMTPLGTLMTDQISFCSSAPLLKNFVDRILVRDHLQTFVKERNLQLKAVAESELWRHYLLPQNQ